ncbi:MAG: S49 family peptidase [Bacteroidales bacterium]
MHINEEFITSHYLMHSCGYPRITAMLEAGGTPCDKEIPSGVDLQYLHAGQLLTMQAKLAASSSSEYNPFSELPEGTIPVFNITGLMTKYSGYDDNWRWHIGMDVIAGWIRQASESDNVSGIIVRANTPGGTTTSLIQLEAAIRACTKPNVMLIDGQLASAGIYFGSFFERILAENKMCEIGSIGAVGSIVDMRKAAENKGIVVREIYPPESKYKNLTHREALDGDDQRMIDEVLTPLALHFQNIIKKNRKKIDLSVDGILEGRMFYADDAIKYKLIDGYGTLQDAIAYINDTANTRKSVSTIF